MKSTKEKISRVKNAILTADKNSSLKNIVNSDSLAFSGIRMLYSTEASGAQMQVDDSFRHVVTGIFSQRRLLAYSDSIRREMESGTSMICFKQRALMDTNLLSELPGYFNGEETKNKEKIDDILNAINTVFSGGFDFSFAMLENLRQFTLDNNPHPVNKIAAAKYFDQRLLGHAKVFSSKTLAQYFEQAEEVWLNYRADKNMWRLVDNRDLIYAVMLKTYYLCWTHKTISLEHALSMLVQYCLDRFGVLPLKELYFSWKVIIGFSVGYFTPVFDESSLKSPKKDSIKRISALAWDLFIFRFSETLLTEEKGNCFYIPSITTLDKGLLDTISSCPVKAMVAFPEHEFIETIFEDQLSFHQCFDNCLTAQQKSVISDQTRNIKGNKTLRHHVSVSIYELEKAINKLV